MMTRREMAVYNKHHGCNCAQSVLMAFEDKMDIPAEKLKALGAGFAAGMGNMNATCGALIGAVMAAGMMNESGVPTTVLSKQMSEAFSESCGAMRCRDLKGIDTGRLLCSCDDCIRHAVEMLENVG